MKALYYKTTPEKLQSMLEEYSMIGYDAEIIDEELVVYYGSRPRKSKKNKKEEKKKQAERWSKRERNFGYTRPN